MTSLDGWVDTKDTLRIVVIGASGQLATALRVVGHAQGQDIRSLGRGEVDLASDQSFLDVLGNHRPDVVINAAAYTQVDKAEDDESLAFAVNAHGPGRLAQACAALGAPLVHVSTDYVFDGTKAGAYVESDAVAPLNVYGRSKAFGEALVLQSGARAAILRTSWVYGASGGNFLKTMLRLGASSARVRVVADQWGRPTWAHDLARDCLGVAALLHCRDARVEGILHASGGGPPCTWADFARHIFDTASAHGANAVEVERIASSEFPTRAARPANSVLSLDRMEAVLGARPDWRDSVQSVCAEIFAGGEMPPR